MILKNKKYYKWSSDQILYSIWSYSIVGYCTRLLIGGSQVRILLGPVPFGTNTFGYLFYLIVDKSLCSSVRQSARLLIEWSAVRTRSEVKLFFKSKYQKVFALVTQFGQSASLMSWKPRVRVPPRASFLLEQIPQGICST